MPTATTRMKAVRTQEGREGAVSLGNVGFGGGCWAGVTRIGRRVQHGKSLGMLLPCGAWGWGGDLRRRKSCSGPGMGAWIGAADALCACSSSPGGRNSLRWFPASQNRGQVLSPSLGGGAVPELEPLLRVLRGGIPVGRVGGVTPPLPGEYRSPLQSPPGAVPALQSCVRSSRIRLDLWRFGRCRHSLTALNSFYI